jgi:hypothetical protein
MKRSRFHEDDHCQRELLPIASWDYCASELTRINEFSEAHRAAIGWAKVYIRGEAPVRLRDLKLTAAAIESIVGSHLPRYHESSPATPTHPLAGESYRDGLSRSAGRHATASARQLMRCTPITASGTAASVLFRLI